MSKPTTQINYASLASSLHKTAHKLSDVQHKIEKVAFDIVKFKDNDDRANLWQIKSFDDGDYIVALYDQSETIEKESDWHAMVVKTAGEVQISYKGDPIARLSAQKLGVQSGELHKVASYLPEKLKTNKKLIEALLKEVSPTVRKQIKETHGL